MYSCTFIKHKYFYLSILYWVLTIYLGWSSTSTWLSMISTSRTTLTPVSTTGPSTTLNLSRQIRYYLFRLIVHYTEVYNVYCFIFPFSIWKASKNLDGKVIFFCFHFLFSTIIFFSSLLYFFFPLHLISSFS